MFVAANFLAEGGSFRALGADGDYMRAHSAWKFFSHIFREGFGIERGRAMFCFPRFAIVFGFGDFRVLLQNIRFRSTQIHTMMHDDQTHFLSLPQSLWNSNRGLCNPDGSPMCSCWRSRYSLENWSGGPPSTRYSYFTNTVWREWNPVVVALALLLVRVVRP